MKNYIDKYFPSKLNTNLINYLHLPIVLIFLIMGIYYRVIHLDLQSVWFDELFSILSASKSSIGEFFEIYKNETNPPFHGLLLYYWFKIFGNSPIAARSLSVLFGIASLVYLLISAIYTKDFTLKKSKYLSLLFLSVSFGAIYFSQEARAYSLMVFLTIPITLYYCELWKQISENQSISLLNFSIFIFLNVLISYTHYFGFIFSAHVLGTLGFLSIIFGSKRSIVMFLLGGLVFIMFFLPEIFKVTTLISQSEKISWIPKPNAAIYYEFFNYVFFINRLNNSWLILLIITIIYIYNFKSNKDKRESDSSKNSVLVSVFLLCLLFLISTYIYSLKKPIITGRNLLVLCFPMIYSLSFIIAKPRKPHFLIIVLLVSFLCYKFFIGFSKDYYKPFKQDFRAAAQYIITSNENASPIFAYNNVEYYNYYFDHLPNKKDLRAMNFRNAEIDLLANPITEAYLIEDSKLLEAFPKDFINTLSQKYEIVTHQENGLTVYKINKKINNNVISNITNIQ